MTKEYSMLIRKAVLTVGLLIALPALCAEEQGMQVTGDSMVASKDSLSCSHCVVSLGPNSQFEVEANHIEANRAGLMLLVGGVRIKLKNGGEIQAERVTVTTKANGEKELSGDEFHIIKADLR
jgi:hypothetical protein